jgi:cytochrome c556
MRTSFLLIAATFSLFAAGLMAQTAKPAAPKPAAAAPQARPATAGYRPSATVKEIMDYIVIPSSEALFNAVGSTTGPNGVEDKAPKTDADWEAVRQRALLLAEAGNLLMVPGRHVASPKDKSKNPGSELEPAQMDALVAKNPALFAQKAAGIRAAALIALKAIDAKDVEGLSNAGGDIDEACESCHLVFWYPNEKKK